VAHDAARGDDPHVSGTSLSAQARYAAGTREILESFLAAQPIRDEYLIVRRWRASRVLGRSPTRSKAGSGNDRIR